jgi:hypothetical protein
MADIKNQLGPKIEPRIESRSVDYAQEVSNTLAGPNPSMANAGAMSAADAPLQDIKSKELISGRFPSEQLRLAVPSIANPFEHSPLGPRHDYHIVSDVVNRFASSAAKNLIALLQSPPRNIPERDISHMRASVARENKMIKLLQDRLSDADRIHGAITRDREG